MHSTVQASAADQQQLALPMPQAGRVVSPRSASPTSFRAWCRLERELFTALRAARESGDQAAIAAAREAYRRGLAGMPSTRGRVR